MPPATSRCPIAACVAFANAASWSVGQPADSCAARVPDTGTMAQSVTKAQRERWFAEGAVALRRTLSGMGMADSLPDSEFYACPLCLVAYGRDAFEAGMFTVEHVPPHSVGGDPLLLTCERCNSTAGTAMDSHAAGREAADDLFAGRSDPAA